MPSRHVLALRRALVWVAVLTVVLGVDRDRAHAQTAARLAVLQAEDRRAATSQDLATLRIAARGLDAQTARIAIRALGRLERPALVTDLLPGLRHRLPEVRAEAANAIAQAAQGQPDSTPPAATLTTAQQALIARLGIEADASVRAAICEAMARLPYRAESDIARAEDALVDVAPRATSSTDRLGLAKGLEAIARLHGERYTPRADTIRLLTELAQLDARRSENEALRDARVRRLALEALIELSAADVTIATTAAADPDPQVRRLAARAAADIEGADAAIARGLTDPAAMVRIEALRALKRRGDGVCEPALAAVSDPDTHVALGAIDQLAACGSHVEVLPVLEHLLDDDGHGESNRQWHRRAHALVALASAAPERARGALAPFAVSSVWQLRVRAARAAAILHERDVLDTLARDSDDNVVEAAIAGLTTTEGHDADPIYVAALSRSASESSGALQVTRAAALALAGSSARDTALPALEQAWRRLGEDTRPGAADTRAAVRDALVSLGAPAPAHKISAPQPAPLTTAELRRLAAPRARFVIRGLGEFDVALFTMEAPATVLRFAQLAASGYYDGLIFHRIVPNEAVEGASSGANEFAGGAVPMRDEVGLWPHVRGALGMSTRNRDGADGRLFINLVDNPRFDHTYTVFAQVLNGIDIVDRILEGDVIERVEILP